MRRHKTPLLQCVTGCCARSCSCLGLMIMIRFVIAHSFCSRRYMTDWWAKRSQLHKKSHCINSKNALHAQSPLSQTCDKPCCHLEFARQLAALAGSLSALASLPDHSGSVCVFQQSIILRPRRHVKCHLRMSATAAKAGSNSTREASTV